jgi:hypothetical protein
MADETPKESPLIEIAVPNEGSRIAIFRVDDISRWVGNEQEAWQILIQQVSSKFSGNHPITSTISKINQDIEKWFQDLRVFSDRVAGEPSLPRIEELRQTLETRYSSEFRKPLSDSLIYQHLCRLSETAPSQAVGAIALVWHVPILNEMLFLSISGALSLLLADEHGKDPEGWRNALVSVIDDAHQKTVELESQFRGVAKQFNDLATKQGQFMADRLKEWQDHLAQCNTDKQKIESLYRNDLATRAAVTYWQDREQSKKRDRVLSLIATIVFMSLTLGAAVFWPLMTQRLGLPTPAPISTDGKTLAPLTEILQFLAGGRVLAVVLGIWCIRLCVRNYLAALHQGADAAERAVMVQTYLALLRDEEVAKNPELTKPMLPAMLQAIFRHASDGYVRDDAIPLTTPPLPGVGKP